MSGAVKEATELLELLPEKDQDFALEIIKRLVLAWDPDFTKVTSREAEHLKSAEDDIRQGETISHDEIDWN